MKIEDQKPPELEMERGDAYARYMLTSRAEILFVLRSLLKHKSLATIYFDHGRSFLLTSLLALDEDGNSLILDYGSDETMDAAALKAPQPVVTARLDRVKIQFRLDRLHAVNFEGDKAFQATIPDTLLRLQRREYFRLETPVSPILFSQATILRDDGLPQTENLQLLDLSGGGVSLMVPEAIAEHLPVGTLLQNCRIALPEEGVITGTLCVRSAFGVTPGNGHSFVRIGCEFINLPGQRLTMIQRFITRIERERKARQSGLE